MARKKRLKIWQIWYVEFARPASRRIDGGSPCYQIIARLVREGKNYWVAVDTTADPPMRACFAAFDDYGREVESAVEPMFAQMFFHNSWPTGEPMRILYQAAEKASYASLRSIASLQRTPYVRLRSPIIRAPCL